ncbi:uncharacterized protein SCHCODRAFT_02693399 [Schizophyllum commune H4-8]|uniref:NACHT domain-containing protein n=1 Tax=Schizophyllum commune (strain H4-8 / FGSC 9210) TaxID=578458 RepID=D8QJ15_SCHCM|nr:uncharacterized protein SCHCODRAFT_02693399 [Schizophyllum commune H4-8]KAI5885779.1 hypothetical protein SCHCODRAFT_02693399 [Schizophyllum commune H4-8]
MCLPPSYTPPPTSSAPKPQPAIIDTLAALWAEAVARYENDTRTKSSTPLVATAQRESTKGSLSTRKLDSADAIFDYVCQHEASFTTFREGGAGPLLLRLRPIAEVVGTLSGLIGEAVGIPFAPGKAVFAAVGELVKASLAIQDDYDAVCTAFETMEAHLRIIQPAVEGDLHPTLREASVKLLAQILTVLGVITKLQREGRIRTWLKRLAQSKEVSSALDDLARLATSHHQAVSAVTLATSQKTLSMLADSIHWAAEDKDMNRQCLTSIAQIAQEVYDEVKRSSSATCQEVINNRVILESLQSTLLHHLAAVEDDRTSADMDKICKWLEYQDSSPRLNELLHHRTPSTGAWFLDGDDFVSLKTGKKRFLWLQGKAGSGKSTMIAGALNDLRATSFLHDSQSLVLSHLFDATNASRSRNLRALLSALLCQLGHLRVESLFSLLRFHKDNMHGHSQPSTHALRRQLDSVLDNSSTTTFVVIDALDEADDENGEILDFLQHLRAHEQVKLLLSSRGEVVFRDRLASLCDSCVIMREDLVEGDIGTVLRGAFAEGGTLGKVKDTDLVREALTAGADGSFRWTAIQIRELSRIAGIPAKVRQKLKALPKSLSETYDRCLQAIDPEDRADVHRLLIWLLLACVPLTTMDFAQLLAFDYSDRIPSYDAGLQPSSADAVLSLVGSTFLSVHDDEVRLAHASVKDYLLALPPTSDFHIDPELAHSLMALTGLACLSAMPDTDQETRPQKPNHLTYSWVAHVAKAGTGAYADLERDTLTLLQGLRGSEYLSDALQAAAQIGHALLAVSRRCTVQLRTGTRIWSLCSLAVAWT